jgi:hypothetical protein
VQALQGREGLLKFLDRATAVMLLKRLRDFNEWSQCLVLDILAEGFRPESDDEMFEVCDSFAHSAPCSASCVNPTFLQYDGRRDGGTVRDIGRRGGAPFRVRQ